MVISSYRNSYETQDDSRILTYDEWKLGAGSKDNYGHYSEYVICKFINNIKGHAVPATDAEDSPGGGDIWIHRSDKTRFMIDIKTTKDNSEIGYEITGPNTANFHIPGKDIEKIRSGNLETQVEVLETLHDLSDKLKLEATAEKNK